MANTTASCILELRSNLGEGPLWHVTERRLYWLDLLRPAIYRFDPKSRENEQLPADIGTYVGGLVFRARGGWIVVKEDGISAVDAGGRRIFATIPEEAGYPDGMTVDAEGFLWNAHWDGWRVTRYAPDGTIDRVIDVPVPRPTAPGFGGTDLATLYITSASGGLGEQQLKEAPLSGSLFACEPGGRGLPEPMFAG